MKSVKMVGVVYPQIIPKYYKSFHLVNEDEKVKLWKIIDRKRNALVGSIAKAARIRFQNELLVMAKDIKRIAIIPHGVEPIALAIINLMRPMWANFISQTYKIVAPTFAEKVINDLKGSKALDPAEAMIIDNFILDYLNEHTATKVVGITETTADQIREVLREGMEAGESVIELTSRIERLYLDQIIPNRSAIIARSEVIKASNFGSLAGARSLGLKGLRKVWLATRDDRTRSAHLAIDGNEIGIDALFTLNTGDMLDFPSDSDHGASADQTVNCRCTIFFEGEDDGLS